LQDREIAVAVVTLEGICKSYPGAPERAVDDVSFVVQDGEFMVLLGPSGCGKSTTLRMIAGLETISEGRLSIDGKAMNAVPAKDRDIAMVFQSYALYPHMTVADNLAFGLRRRGIPRAQIEPRIASVAATLGLTPFLARKPFALSGGQRQRVALGRAIIREPKVFLFDEPLSNLDAALRVSTRNELIKLHHRLAATMIYVTHDQVEAMTMGTRICIMNGGRIAQLGEPLDVYRHPADMFVAGFLGNPPMNLIKTTLTASDSGPAVRISGSVIRLNGFEPDMVTRFRDKAIVLGIRPEDIYEGQGVPGGLNTVPIQGRVASVEPLGAETLLLVALEGVEKEITVRAGRECSARIGDPLTLSLDLNAAHLFDPETTKALPVRPSSNRSQRQLRA
jgi:multiple sugar transport system ATP-binding protein